MYTSTISLTNAFRRSGLLTEGLTGCNWLNCVARDNGCPVEMFEVLIWPVEEWLPDDSADDSASEYEISPLAAEDGASSDLATGDLHTDTE